MEPKAASEKIREMVTDYLARMSKRLFVRSEPSS